MWATITSAVIGLWVMVSPAVLPMSRAAANNNHIAGPLVITFSLVALWDINRNAIKVNLLLGAWLLIALFVLTSTTPVIISNALSALALLMLAWKKRNSKQNFGGGWRSLFQHNPPHLQAAEQDGVRMKA
jgi:hypothetical protein